MAVLILLSAGSGIIFFMVQTALGALGRGGGNDSSLPEYVQGPGDSRAEGARFFERICWASGVLTNISSGVLAVDAGTRLIASHPFWGALAAGIVVVASQFLLLDVIARHLSMRRPATVLRWLGFPALLLSYPLRPILRLVVGLGDRRSPSQGTAARKTVRDRELRLLPHVHGVDRVVEEEAIEMIDSVREFSESTARQIMTPRTDVEGIPIDLSREEVYRLLRETNYSRLPVYRGNLDDIAGFLLAKEVLLSQPDNPFDLLREPLTVSDSTRLPDLLLELRRAHASLAFVVDQYGGTAGIVTLHDLFETLIGEHLSEEEEEDELWIQIADKDHATLSGRVEIWEVNEELDLELDEKIARTLGGYLMHKFGKVPEEDEEWTVDGGVFRVLGIASNRVESVAFTRNTAARETSQPASEGVS